MLKWQMLSDRMDFVVCEEEGERESGESRREKQEMSFVCVWVRVFTFLAPVSWDVPSVS